MNQFKVGDKVWCLMFGEGLVVSVANDAREYPVMVRFGCQNNTYSESGVLLNGGKRSLFFSEPKIEAATRRPFVPTLNGRFVVVTFSGGCLVGTVHDENEDHFFLDTGYKVIKNDIVRIQEISKENLLQ